MRSEPPLDAASAQCLPGFALEDGRVVIDSVTELERARECRAVGREVSAVTTDDAALLMYATAPGRRGPLPRGMSRAGVGDPGWRVTDEEAFDVSGTPGGFKRAHPRWYRLQPSASARS